MIYGFRRITSLGVRAFSMVCVYVCVCVHWLWLVKELRSKNVAAGQPAQDPINAAPSDQHTYTDVRRTQGVLRVLPRCHSTATLVTPLPPWLA